MDKIRVGIIGATGYAGQEIVRILSNYPQAEIVTLASHSYAGKPYSSVYPNHRSIHDVVCAEEDMEELAEQADVIFLALPHGLASAKVTEEILAKCKIIDLGADFRLKDPAVYEQWYKTEHHGKELLAKEAVYGLCEWNREQIRTTRLLANPGCYTTCSILSLSPLVAEGMIQNDSIIIDAKSGVSGAGRGAKLENLYAEVNESIKAYGVGTHRHTPEIEEQLGYRAGENITLTFTPHLVPMQRGILAVCYAALKGKYNWEDIHTVYEDYYGREKFIRLLPQNVYPETRWVKGSNYCDIGWKVDARTGRVIVIGAIDNLGKGAAGQAVQNMNRMFGLKEDTGLDLVPMFP